jgi:serine phosphatase RsbU (regulator of sigma subunit)
MDWPETELPLLPGSTLTLVSDGVVEAANADGQLFGFDRTREISTKSAREVAEAARAWGQNDDITVVTVRRSSNG